MGIFSRRRAALADLRESWQPDGPPRVAMANLVDDERAVGPRAYGVTFTLGIAPGASLTIWSYPVPGPDDVPGSYIIGRACVYRSDPHDAPGPWTAWRYDEDPEWHFSLAECDAYCAEEADELATTLRVGPSVDDLPFFDWDGVPVR